MQVNQFPYYDQSDNRTGCCPRFNPQGWDGQELHFRNKSFIRAETKSLMHVPVNMGKVFSRVKKRIDEAGAVDKDGPIVLSRDVSAWTGEHFFAVSKPVPREAVARLSGDFLTKVFEGPYREAKHWQEEMQNLARAKGKEPKRVMFFYTTCPKCAGVYGKNYVVGVVEV